MLSGKYICHDNDGFLGSSIVFEVDNKSKNFLPKLVYDNRFIWFVFSNYEEAVKAFGKPGSRGEATIVIDDYTIRYKHTDTYNEAKLVRVIQ
ncbi:hypothetical protein P378_18780 [Desulforamulus profundi]|uniref:Uncharacterized protein n=1 Tax=Desulforamulus profundi TaxID=1383067 RepID=A0A2C6LGE4_9FIRM|nr:hypothetical protein [Desulforamulus profundi]PHJ37100.1 hypothetical protein P378_18780 [Desulforamulus profundi]